MQFLETRPSTQQYGQSTIARATNGVTIPGPTYEAGPFFPSTAGHSTPTYLGPNGDWCVMWAQSPSGCINGTVGSSLTIRWTCANAGSYGFDGPNIGGACGIHPNAGVSYGRTNGQTGQHFNFIVHTLPGLRESGWQRRTVTDVNCFGAGWVRAESQPYWDNAPTSRIATPTCAPGSRPIEIRVQRAPTGVQCATLGGLCGHTSVANAWQVFHWEAPLSWTSASPPPEAVCLTAGAVCSEPAMDLQTNTCTWGANVVNATYCDPARQTGRDTDPNLMPKADPTVAPTPYTPGVVPSTVTDTPPAPTPTTVPGGATVVVPIDPGAGLRTEHADVQGCWPGGWGWFNPAEWVYRPITCAVEWAFVPTPTALDARLANFNGLRDQPPVQWADAGLGWVGDTSFVFAQWSEAGPACTALMDTAVCPREWDQTGAAPGWLLVAITFGLWSGLVFAVWRWF